MIQPLFRASLSRGLAASNNALAIVATIPLMVVAYSLAHRHDPPAFVFQMSMVSTFALGAYYYSNIFSLGERAFSAGEIQAHERRVLRIIYVAVVAAWSVLVVTSGLYMWSDVKSLSSVLHPWYLAKHFTSIVFYMAFVIIPDGLGLGWILTRNIRLREEAVVAAKADGQRLKHLEFRDHLLSSVIQILRFDQVATPLLYLRLQQDPTAWFRASQLKSFGAPATVGKKLGQLVEQGLIQVNTAGTTKLYASLEATPVAFEDAGDE